MAGQLKVDVNVMPRIIFTGDSQTCGCVGAMDYAQMLAREIPLRVFNRAVGGSNTSHLLGEFGVGQPTLFLQAIRGEHERDLVPVAVGLLTQQFHQGAGGGRIVL